MEEQVMTQPKKGKGIHWGCCWLPLLGGLSWIVALLSAISAWMAMRSGADATSWYWNALAFGVLALYTRGKKMGSCKAACGDHKCC